MDFPAYYPEILVAMADLFHRRMCNRLPPDQAETLARELAEDIRINFGGGLIYIPKGSSYDRYQRDIDIWREFNGRNHFDLARKYHLGVAAIYDILARKHIRHQRTSFG